MLRWNVRMNVEVGETYFVARGDDGRDVEIEFQYEGNALNAFEKDEPLIRIFERDLGRDRSPFCRCYRSD